MKAISILFILFGLFMDLFSYYNKKKLKSEIRLLIYVIGTSMIIFSLSTNLLGALARIFGVGRGVDLIVYVSIILIFYLVFLLYLKIEDLNEKLTRLVREDAIKNAKKKNK